MNNPGRIRDIPHYCFFSNAVNLPLPGNMIHVLESALVNSSNVAALPSAPIRVLIIDDHPGVRDGLKNMLSAEKDLVVVGEAGSGAEAIELVATQNPDILLLDIELPDIRGDIVMRNIHDMQPDMKVLAVSSYSDRDYILGMMQHGAAGYITKDEVPAMLMKAIRKIVNDNGSWFSPQAIRNSTPTPLESQRLTPREVQILEQLILDRSPDEIAASLGIGKTKVEKYLNLLLKKYETESLVLLKQVAQRVLFLRGS